MGIKMQKFVQKYVSCQKCLNWFKNVLLFLNTSHYGVSNANTNSFPLMLDPFVQN